MKFNPVEVIINRMKKKNKNYSHLPVSILIIVLVFLFFTFNYRIIREREGNEEKIEKLQYELSLLEERRTDLEESLTEAEDRRYVERVLREDFLMKKPGEEKVIILLDEEEEFVDEEEEEEKSRWQKVRGRIPFFE